MHTSARGSRWIHYLNIYQLFFRNITSLQLFLLLHQMNYLLLPIQATCHWVGSNEEILHWSQSSTNLTPSDNNHQSIRYHLTSLSTIWYHLTLIINPSDTIWQAYQPSDSNDQTIWNHLTIWSEVCGGFLFLNNTLPTLQLWNKVMISSFWRFLSFSQP